MIDLLEVFQRIRELLQISERDAGQCFCPQVKSFYVRSVGPDDMFRAAVQADFEEVVVGIRLAPGDCRTALNS